MQAAYAAAYIYLYSLYSISISYVMELGLSKMRVLAHIRIWATPVRVYLISDVNHVAILRKISPKN